MSDTKKLSVVSNESKQNKNESKAVTVPFAIKSQYIKDFSFENPYAHEILSKAGEKPSMNVSVNVGAKPLSNDLYEVVLQVNVKAKYDNKTAFLSELSYAGLFEIKKVETNILNALLLVECPRYLFPFARNVIADSTREGGFPPVFLQPIDFAALYKQKLQSLKPKEENKKTPQKEETEKPMPKVSSSVH